MCGIAGILAPRWSADEGIEQVARNMARRLIHRGPDDKGEWSDPSSGVALAHRRLSILDLSDAGHQPMASACGRYILAFNGEIYNHLTMRRELEVKGWPRSSEGWRGHSDTETLLAAISEWGVEQALHKSVGMFAFALWDRVRKTLFLARDRLGEKPLYYGLQAGTLLLSSELKALRAYPGFHGEVDRESLALFLSRNAIPAPYSIYRGIFKLPPGAWLAVTLDDVANGKLPRPVPYWSLPEVAERGQNNLFQGSVEEACVELERLLKQSISSQMLADVPLGAFLSGGVDSSSVVALMKAQADLPVRTFTIGFHEGEYDEARHARAVASHLGTEHTELFVTPEQALDVIPRLPVLYDEPFADVSQIPTFLVCQLARKHVTVCLSGDGGDELFGGYNRYVSGARLWRKLGWLPLGVRASLGDVLTRISPSLWDAGFDRLGAFLPSSWRYRTPGEKLHKMAEMLSVTSSGEIYGRLVSQWRNPERLLTGSMVPVSVIQDGVHAPGLRELEHQMMLLDATSYLPDDILVKVDRAAMAVSLETRVPMLDHRLVEFAWTLPLEMKIRGAEGKWLLRRVLDRHVPRSLIERPKTGFGVPIGAWLRGPLKTWAEELLDPSVLKSQGFFEPEPIRVKWEEHVRGKRSWSHQLWGVLMFQAWLYEHHGQW